METQTDEFDQTDNLGNATERALSPSEKWLERERGTTSQIVSKQIHRVPSSAIISCTLGHAESHAA